jgi:hypothetical protein
MIQPGRSSKQVTTFSVVCKERKDKHVKNKLWVDRLIQCCALFALLIPGCFGQVQLPKLSKEEARVSKSFNTSVQQYLKLRTGLEASMPTLNPTIDATRIAEHQHALAGLVAQARQNARQGDVFTHEVTEYFLGIIHGEFQGPKSKLAKETKRQDDAGKRITPLRVNPEYPAEQQLTAMPPILLLKLPQLPKELAYRIVGRDLALKDTKAELIIDFIPKAIP